MTARNNSQRAQEAPPPGVHALFLPPRQVRSRTLLLGCSEAWRIEHREAITDKALRYVAMRDCIHSISKSTRPTAFWVTDFLPTQCRFCTHMKKCYYDRREWKWPNRCPTIAIMSCLILTSSQTQKIDSSATSIAASQKQIQW